MLVGNFSYKYIAIIVGSNSNSSSNKNCQFYEMSNDFRFFWVRFALHKICGTNKSIKLIYIHEKKRN